MHSEPKTPGVYSMQAVSSGMLKNLQVRKFRQNIVVDVDEPHVSKRLLPAGLLYREVQVVADEGLDVFLLDRILMLQKMVTVFV